MKDDGVSPLSTGLLLPDAVKRVCDEGVGLRWDHEASCYEVVDGAMFEKRFDELRRKRDRDDGSNGRPFSRMHKYYKLEAGERWAKTGARFSPKSPLLLRNLQAAHGPNRPANFDAYAPIFDETATGGYGEHDEGNPLQSVPAQELSGEAGLKRQRNNEGGYTDYIHAGDGFSVANSSASTHAHQNLNNSAIDADNIKIKLRTRSHLPYVSDTMEVSLQTFLDAVDAGGQYMEALQQKQSRSLQSPDFSTEASSPGESDADLMATVSEAFVPFQPKPEPMSPEQQQQQQQMRMPHFGVPPAMNVMDEDPPHPQLQAREESRDLFGEMLQSSQQSETLGEMGAWGMWNEASKGDQAYFFRRKLGAGPFFNGAVVALRDGVLVPADDLKSTDIFMVVSDLNAKWKGEPAPSKDQEHLGHWCAYLGQVPLQVAGPVKAGDYLGPVGDGSGLARVVRPGQAPVVGLALAAKTSGEVGTVKGMISVGLNALSMPAELATEQHAEVLKRVERVGERLALLKEDAREAREKATRAVAVAEKTEGRVREVEAHVEGIEQEVRKAKASQHKLHEQLDSLMEEPVLSRRQYLWSCFCGLFSITVTEQPGRAHPKKSEPAKPQSLVHNVAKTCVEVMDEIVSDTIVNLAMTCVLLNGWNLLGLSGTFNGVLSECMEMVFHFCFLLYFLKPVGMVGAASYMGLRNLWAPQKEGEKKKSITQVVTCPASLVYSVRSKWFVLLFWYAVAAHIIWNSIHEYKTLAPFGYAYLMVLTLKTTVQVAVRGFVPPAPSMDIEMHTEPVVKA